jgi:hypothetical protein
VQLRTMSALVAILGSMAMASACATPPRQQLMQTQSAIRAAEEVGAEDTPKAAYHLRVAQEQLEIGRGLMNDEERQAELILRRAEVDAELAMAYARSDEAWEEARQARDEVRDLQEELQELE